MKLLLNARIHTLDPKLPLAGALLIERGRILAAGGDELREQAPGAERIDLGGRTVLPGLTDAHLHLKHYSLLLQKIDCETNTFAECLRRVEERARTARPGEWILGHGWNQNFWSDAPAGDGRLPGYGCAADLDAVAPRNPVYLTAKSLHAGWANGAAMRLAGVTPGTADPAEGRVGRGADGQPDGLFFESAMHLISAAVPEPSDAEIAEAMRTAQSRLWRMGLTGVHDFDYRSAWIALQTLRADGSLRLRVIKSVPPDDLEAAEALGLRSGFGDDWLRVGSLKLFLDGALGPRTAAMLEPYEREPENRGMLNKDSAALIAIGRRARAIGLSLAVHAIGDQANRAALDAFAVLRAEERANGLPPLRHRIEHVQLLHPDDLPRLAELEIIASMQPIHVPSDMGMADRYWGQRARLAYAWQSVAQTGARLAFGSDAPVESANPFWGLHAAVTRRRADGSPGPDGWHPSQRLTLDQALRGFTRGAAWAAGMEDRLGKLASGYLADLIVLERDPFSIPPDELRELHPGATMVGGEWVWKE